MPSVVDAKLTFNIICIKDKGEWNVYQQILDVFDTYNVERKLRFNHRGHVSKPTLETKKTCDQFLIIII